MIFCDIDSLHSFLYIQGVLFKNDAFFVLFKNDVFPFSPIGRVLFVYSKYSVSAKKKQSVREENSGSAQNVVFKKDNLNW